MEHTKKQFRIVIIILLVTVVVNKTRRDGKTLTALEIGNPSREEKNGSKGNWKKKKVDKLKVWIHFYHEWVVENVKNNS